MMKPPLVVGNWKMHGTESRARALARAVLRGLRDVQGVEVALAPPFTALSAVRDVIKRSAIRLAGQDVHWEVEGAFTGEVSAKMLRAVGCRFVIVGHSERRRLFHEDDEIVAKKLLAAARAGLRPILCVGETLPERNQGRANEILDRQLRAGLKDQGKDAIGVFDVAYEPVWAIGTGHNATPDQVSEAHRWIRQMLEELCGKENAERLRILYGGSVRPDNAAQLAATAGVNGFLVGGASLKGRDFLRIIRSFVPERG